KSRRPSPHAGSGMTTHGPPTLPEVGQRWPGSTERQLLAQPSPERGAQLSSPMPEHAEGSSVQSLPSSHCKPSSQASSPITRRSPQTISDAHGSPATGHCQYGSRRHCPSQPSPGVTLRSSHSSWSASTPSPQNASAMQSSPGTGQLWPASRRQTSEQPSPATALPSSQVSGYSTWPLPHTALDTGSHGIPGAGQL